MKKILFVFVLFLIAVIFSGCWTITYYEPGTATDNKIDKVGEGPANGGVAKIAKEAGLNKIATIDFRIVEYHNGFAGLFNKGRTLTKIEQVAIVSGE